MKESIIFTLDGRADLIEKIIKTEELYSITGKTKIGNVNIQKFSDGEICVDFINSVRGKRVYLLTTPNTSDEIMKLCSAIDAAKRASASEIIPILPCFPYSRGDKKDYSRGPIGAKMIANMLVANGITGLISFDFHTDQIQGFFDIPITHIEGKNIFVNQISMLMQTSPLNSFILCAPDSGAGKRVKRMQKSLRDKFDLLINYVVMDKTRGKANEVDEMFIIGDVTGKDVIIIDDMIDTFGTADKAINTLLDNGAKTVRMIASHGVLSGPAYKRLLNSKITELIISDSIKIQEEYYEQVDGDLVVTKLDKKIQVVSIANEVAKAMLAINNCMSYEAIKSLRNDI